MAVRRESKELLVYAFVSGKNGPKLKLSTVKANAIVPNPRGQQCTRRMVRRTRGEPESGK
jgi:uncharacterized protein (TIGR03435 family)